MFLGCRFFNGNRFTAPVFRLLNRFGFCHCSQLVWELPQPCQQSAFRSLTDCIPFPTLQNPDHPLFFASGSFFLPNRQQSLCFLFSAAAECCNWTFLTVWCSIRNTDQCSQFHEGLCKHPTFSSWIADFQRLRNGTFHIRSVNLIKCILQPHHDSKYVSIYRRRWLFVTNRTNRPSCICPDSSQGKNFFVLGRELSMILF